ncbi:D-inositol 3-phosphate glycosyltransferase [bacterium HR19]|nr:D-inositol 3-phosphate glycosyltransferase [bacterium HR19]
MKVILDGTQIFDEKGAGIKNYCLNIAQNLLKTSNMTDEIYIGVRPSRWNKIKNAEKYPLLYRRVKKILTFSIIGEPLGILKEKFDIYHGLGGKIYRFLDNKKIKYVLTIHHLEKKDEIERAKVFAKFADIIITISSFSKRRIIEKLNIDERKVKVIYNGVSEKFRPLPNRDEIKKNFSGKTEKIVLILITGDTVENIENIEKAIDILKKRFKGVRFISAGIKDVRGCENLGYIDEDRMVELYNLADVLLFPAVSGGFGLPIVESMACGCPVITSLGGAHEEIAGNSALLCNPYSPEDIAEKVEKILTSPELQKKLSEEGLKRAKMFSWEKSAKEIYEIYKSLTE